MQSLQDTQVLDEASSSRTLSNGDTNANLLNGMKENPESRGAIPKIKTVKIKSVSGKKAIKVNNNIEEISENRVDPLLPNGCNSSNNSSNSSVQKSDPFAESLLTCDINSLVLIKDKRYEHALSSDEDDLLSISDDGCIYTYKGDQDADLPMSFFNLDVPEIPPPDRRLSPEMDYLEMDFDPDGGENEKCEKKEDINPGNTEENIENNLREGAVCSKQDVFVTSQLQDLKDNNEKEVVIEKPTIIELQVFEDQKVPPKKQEVEMDKENMTVNTLDNNLTNALLKETGNTETQKAKLHYKDMPWSCTLNERTTAIKGKFILKECHARGELVNPSQSQHSSSSEKSTPSPIAEVKEFSLLDDCAMIWTPDEARFKQVTQIGPSACGATAVLNALNALKFSVTIHKVLQNINTKLRKNSAPLAEYLLSRSNAGTTHKDIIDCIHKVTEGKVYARFFHMFPERIVNLETWLKFWIRGGAVPIATLNIQQAKKGTQNIPDAWHHQMIFGVSPAGIYFTNPIECISDDLVWPQLVSESVLLIQREDILSRWNIEVDMPNLMTIEDMTWRNLNVVGQVAHIIYQSRRELKSGFKNTTHIKIPAAYSSGITIAIPVTSPLCPLLQQCPELPVFDTWGEDLYSSSSRVR